MYEVLTLTTCYYASTSEVASNYSRKTCDEASRCRQAKTTYSPRFVVVRRRRKTFAIQKGVLLLRARTHTRRSPRYINSRRLFACVLPSLAGPLVVVEISCTCTRCAFASCLAPTVSPMGTRQPRFLTRVSPVNEPLR